jgi:hypothetical protein
MNTETNLTEDLIIDNFKSATEHLIELVSGKFLKLGNDHPKLHLYQIKIDKTPTRKDYHLFSFDLLHQISRKLTNSQTSLGSVTNRKFWNKYFLGGVRLIHVSQREYSEFPTFSIIYFLVSETDNLDVRISKSLSIRLKSIDPTLDYSFDYIGRYETGLINKHIPQYRDLDLSTDVITKLGTDVVEEIYRTEFQRPRFLGSLFKSKTHENLNN